MKISLDWLRDYVDFQGTCEELDELLTHAGFPIEEIAQVGDDWMLDVEITSNRPDCLGHIGIAREVAALTGAELKLPAVDFAENGPPVESITSVDNQAQDICRRYTARCIRDVNVGPSPDWMQRRLLTIGQRPISNVVDITNYVMLEVGQPLHAFDHDLLGEGRIVVRRAAKGEKLQTINHVEHTLDADMLVIADADKPVAMAGIMGGLTSEVSDGTKNVLLESAHFDPLTIRRAGRALTLSSESSFRFERNVDISMLEWASRRATALLAELAGGTVAVGVVDPDYQDAVRPQVTMRLSRMRALLGIDIALDRVLQILQALGLAPQHDGQDNIVCTVPTWRCDIDREVDLIEEIIRIHGYEHVPTEQRIHITVTTPDAFQKTRQSVANTLNSSGYFECVNVSFIEDKYQALFAADGFNPVRVNDMTRKADNALRHTVLPSLLTVRKRNQDAGNARCDLYELSAVHEPSSEKLPKETLMLGIVTDGDFRELRGTIETVVRRLDRTAEVCIQPTKVAWAQADAGADVLVNGDVIGQAGQLAANLIKAFDLNEAVCAAEIDFNKLVPLQGRISQLQPLARFPGIQRDLSLVLDEAVTWEQIEQCIHGQQVADLEAIEFVGIYRGKGIDKGKKSLTLSIMFRRAEETLTHEQVDVYQERIIQALANDLTAELRA